MILSIWGSLWFYSFYFFGVCVYTTPKSCQYWVGPTQLDQLHTKSNITNPSPIGIACLHSRDKAFLYSVLYCLHKSGYENGSHLRQTFRTFSLKMWNCYTSHTSKRHPYNYRSRVHWQLPIFCNFVAPKYLFDPVKSFIALAKMNVFLFLYRKKYNTEKCSLLKKMHYTNMS